MDLSLKNYKKELPADLLKKAAKDKVRECDETQLGHFVAYVDEGEDTYDTSLTLQPKGTIITHTCDCKNNPDFCRHKTALLLFLAKRKKETSPTKKKSKEPTATTLLDTVDPVHLKAWVKELLLSNKDIELAFTHRFSEQRTYTPDDIKQLTLDAVKAVTGNKKNVESGQVKKLVELWSQIHQPIVTHYYTHLTNKAAFHNFEAILETCRQVTFKINTTSIRIKKYMEELLLNLLPPFLLLHQNDDWNTATTHLSAKVTQVTGTALDYLQFLGTLLAATPDHRRIPLATQLIKQYASRPPQPDYIDQQYIIAMYTLAKNNNLLAEHILLFRPIRFQNEYNNTLIRSIIAHGHLSVAEVWCQAQISGNFRDEYNILYLQLLNDIYTLQKDDEKRAQILKELFPKIFGFDNFLFINNRMIDGPEKIKWRNHVLARARQMAPYHIPARLFSFELMAHEGNYQKMIEYIDARTPYELIAKYAEPMAATNKEGLLKTLLTKQDGQGLSDNETVIDSMLQAIASLLNTLSKHFTEEELRIRVNETKLSNQHFYANQFVIFLKRL